MSRIDRRQFVSTAVIGAALGTAGLGARAAAAPRYRITDLGDLGGSLVRVHGLSPDGVATGMATRHDQDHQGVAFVADGRRMRGLPYDGVPASGAAINAHGVVAGNYGYKFGHPTPAGAWLWVDGQRQDITLGGGYYVADTVNDLNDAGQATGRTHSYLGYRFQEGRMDVLQQLPGYLACTGYGINAQGDVVGEHYHGDVRVGSRGFAWFDGVAAVLDMPGVFSHAARAVNDARQVCGRLQRSPDEPVRAFVWQAGVTTDLGALGGDASMSEALALNNAGLIVGHSSLPRLRDRRHVKRAVVWHGGVLHRLDSLLEESSAGWALISAVDVNDRGQIVGQGRFGGVERAYLATPVDG